MMGGQVSSLVLGNDVIDNEHQAFMTVLAKFIDCLKDKADAEVALALLRKAIEVGNAHMEHEEILMDETSFPYAEEHKRFHRTARLRYTTLMSDVFAFQAHDPALLEKIAMIEGSLREHILGPDRQFAEYLKINGKEVTGNAAANFSFSSTAKSGDDDGFSTNAARSGNARSGTSAYDGSVYGICR